MFPGMYILLFFRSLPDLRLLPKLDNIQPQLYLQPEVHSNRFWLQTMLIIDGRLFKMFLAARVLVLPRGVRTGEGEQPVPTERRAYGAVYCAGDCGRTAAGGTGSVFCEEVLAEGAE